MVAVENKAEFNVDFSITTRASTLYDWAALIDADAHISIENGLREGDRKIVARWTTYLKDGNE